MKVITSSSNTLYKDWQRMARGASPRAYGLLLEGAHVCQAWLAHFGQPVWALLKQDSQTSPEVEALAAEVSPDAQAWLPARLMRGLSTLSSEPAVMFVVQPPALALPDCISDSALMLDCVQDPGNVGTLLRNAAAAGIKHVLAGHGTASCWSSKALRAGQGAQFGLSIYESVDLLAWISKQIEQDAKDKPRPQLVATSLADGADSLYDTELDETVLWLFGHEGQGVSTPLLAMADRLVHIPHDASAVESLNVASAAAICLFEHRRRRLAASSKP